jgi:DNA-binding NtrC family response regulator
VARQGAFERAQGGTLFLDEIGELPIELQPKLLRAIGEHQVRRLGGNTLLQTDVRLIAATNRDLRREVNRGTFRADLFYRLAVIHVRMPAVRERLEDIPELVRALLVTIADEREIPTRVGLTEEEMAALYKQPWPGNVRELRNYLEHVLVLSAPPSERLPTVSTNGLDALRRVPLRIARARFEEQYLRGLLEDTGRNVAEAARRAGMSRATLFRLIRRYGIECAED